MPIGRNQRPYNVEYYQRNREAEIARVTRRQQATLAWLRNLRRVPCLDCGGTFPPHVMDFDHRDPKTKLFNVGHELFKSREVIAREISKCDIVCANCHRVRTYLGFLAGQFVPPVPPRKSRTPTRERALKRFHETRSVQTDLLRAFRSTPCTDCHRSFPWYVMEFDYREPSAKRTGVPLLAGRASLQRLLEELEKCDIVCANCHRIRRYMRREAENVDAGVS